MRFEKPPLSYEQQLDHLIERGMQCPDRARALHYLKHLNYYRLSAYWLPFEVDHATHRFTHNTAFDAVLDLYVFDRELRLLVMDAIERIEVSARTSWAYHLAHEYGPHAHMDADLFKRPRRNWDYAGQRNKLATEIKRSRETFVIHLRSKYEEPLPPIWALVEIMTFGELSKWIGNLRHGRDRNAVAHRYDMDEVNLCSFLHHLAVVRNICAHHARLWNREFTFTYQLPTHRPTAVVASLNPDEPRRLYNTLVMLGWLMGVISPDHHWKHRLKALIAHHGIETRQMGFPEDFTVRPVWAETWRAST